MTATFPTVSRDLADITPLTFSWPVSGATITALKSINGATAAEVVGAISYVGEASGTHLYRLAWNAADRPSSAGTVLYTFSAGGVTRLLPLSVTDDCKTGETPDPESPPLLTPDAVGEAMSGPRSMTVEGNTITAHSLPDQIAADKYRRSLVESEKPLSKRLRIGRFVPPGTT